MISYMVKICHDPQDRIIEVVQNELVVTKQQAIAIGRQILYEVHFAKKHQQFDTQYEDYLNIGEIVDLDVNTLAPAYVNYRIKAKTITIDGAIGKVKMNLEVEGNIQIYQLDGLGKDLKLNILVEV